MAVSLQEGLVRYLAIAVYKVVGLSMNYRLNGGGVCWVGARALVHKWLVSAGFPVEQPNDRCAFAGCMVGARYAMGAACVMR